MSKPENVKCPECDGPMVSRKSQHGVFWGCAQYPKCKGTRNADGESRRRFDEENDSREHQDEMPSRRLDARDKRRWESQ